jgi:hypothetical protein
MSGQLARLVAASLAAAVIGALALAVPAYAEGEVDVNLASLDSSMDPGDNDTFSIRLRNRTKQQFQPLRVVITVRLDGLEREHVRVDSAFGELQEQGGSGQVRLSEIGYFLNEEGRRNSGVTIPYRITFSNSAPGGRAQVTAEAIFANQVLGTDQDEVDIDAKPAPTRTTEAPQTKSQGPVVEATGPPLAPVDGQAAAPASQDSGTPTFLYIMGGALVLAGGVMLWLLFRRPRPALVDGAPIGPDTGPLIAPSRLSHPIYPPSAPRQATPPTAPIRPAPMGPYGSTPPTAAMPPHVPQHAAVDPWADSAEDQFPR